jgi:uncharacterized protein YdaU (DUF1376 family)
VSNPWTAFYWRDHLGKTGHLTLAEHGAYLLLMAHYYMCGKPLPVKPEQLHRICRCTSDADREALAAVVGEFFVREGDVYRHPRIDMELARAADISHKRRSAALTRHGKVKMGLFAGGVQVGVQMDSQAHTQSHPRSQRQTAARGGFKVPTFEEVRKYCRERGNHVDPQQWMDHYKANGWMVGRTAMKDWKASIRTWECNGGNYGRAKANRAEQRTADNLAALNAAFPLDR